MVLQDQALEEQELARWHHVPARWCLAKEQEQERRRRARWPAAVAVLGSRTHLRRTHMGIRRRRRRMAWIRDEGAN